MPTFIDQIGNSIFLDKTPKKIISIVPSQSEFLWDLGLKQTLIGITKFCINPNEMFISIERVGGTKNLNIEKIRELKPDLIIGNKEENDKQQIEILQKEFKVWMSDIYNFDDALMMMRSIGEMTDKKAQSEKMITDIKNKLSTIKNLFEKQKTIYFIWNKPYMLAGRNTFINYVLNYIGLSNCADYIDRYPELSIKQIQSLSAKFCFLSSEPFPFKEEHINEMQKLLPDCKVIIVDGEMFSWYGSRLTKLPDYIRELKKELLK